MKIATSYQLEEEARELKTKILNYFLKKPIILFTINILRKNELFQQNFCINRQ